MEHVQISSSPKLVEIVFFKPPRFAMAHREGLKGFKCGL